MSEKESTKRGMVASERIDYKKFLFLFLMIMLICMLSYRWGRRSFQDGMEEDPQRLANSWKYPTAVCQKLWRVDSDSEKDHFWSFNSGNPEKQEFFQDLFKRFDMKMGSFTEIDINEIEACHDKVVIHKASSTRADWVLVEDSALDVEGEEIGVNIKWNIQHLLGWIGRKATYVAKLAYKVDGVVFVYTGTVHGTIVEPRGEAKKGAEFDPYFLPDGSSKTLAEGTDDEFSPRTIAMKKLVSGKVDLCSDVMISWNGPWQEEQSFQRKQHMTPISLSGLLSLFLSLLQSSSR